MSHTVKQLADLAGISVRTLHYYDQIGLLKPQRVNENGYREYGEKEILCLQQILFFRELDFGLEEIKAIIDKPDFDMMQALKLHRTLLQRKVDRLHGLIETVDKTLLNLKGELTMSEKEYYGGFSREQQEKYEQEIKEKYGDKALNESRRRMKKWNPEEFKRITEESNAIFTAIKENMAKGHDSREVQEQVKRLHRWLNNFYSCDYEILKGLGHLYNEHPDFVKMYRTRYDEKMPEFLLQAIEYYCDHPTVG